MKRRYVVFTASLLVFAVLLLGSQMVDTEKQQDEIMIMQLELEALKIEQETIASLLDTIETLQREKQELLRILSKAELYGDEI